MPFDHRSLNNTMSKSQSLKIDVTKKLTLTCKLLRDKNLYKVFHKLPVNWLTSSCQCLIKIFTARHKKRFKGIDMKPLFKSTLHISHIARKCIYCSFLLLINFELTLLTAVNFLKLLQEMTILKNIGFLSG